MRGIISILLATFILSIAVQDLATFVSFKINQHYIIANHCVNRNVPKLNCNGKCFLAKKIAESQKPDLPVLQYDKQNIVLHWEEIASLNFSFFEGEKRETTFLYREPLSQNLIHDLFRPPEV